MSIQKQTDSNSQYGNERITASNGGNQRDRQLKTDSMPGVVFSMRYPDNAGYVWNTIALGRDKAGSFLAEAAKCFIAYPELTNNATYLPRHLAPVQMDCYDMSPNGKRLLSDFIRENRVRVIVFMSALPSTIDLPFFRRLGVRTINTENDSFDHRRRDNFVRGAVKFIVRRILKRQLHDMHLANARSQQAFLTRYALIPPSRLQLLLNGIDCERFCPGDRTAARRQTHMADDTFWVICVAQARPEKRLDLVIRAAKRVVDAKPDINIGFIYVGESNGTLTTELKQLVNELGLENIFHFAGRQDDLVPYYRSADIMVHAAERESFGLAVVEAMACGLPVIASAAAGPKETILHEETGALIDIDDFDGFVNAILRYIDNRELVEKHGKRASEHACSNFSIKRYGEQLAGHISRFL